MSNLRTISHIDLPTKKERHKLFGSVEPGPKTKPTTKECMADIQNSKKDFFFTIDAVGIGNVKYPITVKSNLQPTKQTTIGTFTLTSKLDRMSKGTNMSRFLEQLEQSNDSGLEMNFESLQKFAKELQARLNQEEVTIQVSFPWFYDRPGPTSKSVGMNHSNVTMSLTYRADHTVSLNGSLSTYITTLCPCSKEISEYSAHSQRGLVSMDVTFTEDFNENITDWKEDLLVAAESNGSSVIYPVLKRPDEKFVTETAYENPRFVEDVARLVAADLYELSYVSSFKVVCNNEESIHLHDAVATIEYTK